MSREFGIYESCGYFHHKIDRAIDDLKWESDKDYTDEIKILESDSKKVGLGIGIGIAITMLTGV